MKEEWKERQRLHITYRRHTWKKGIWKNITVVDSRQQEPVTKEQAI